MGQWMYQFYLRRSRRSRRLRPEQTIVLAFAAIVLVGTALLALPAASRSGESCGFLTALFTSTSATCITGIVLADTWVQWSPFGQLVVISLVQIGALGFMSMVSVFFFLFRRKMGLKQRLIIAQGFSLNDVAGVVELVRTVLLWTLVFELIGALVLTLHFWPAYGFPTALRWGVFHSISAFCNAGFDLFGELQPGSSLGLFVHDPLVNWTVMALTVIGGLGFYVWIDLAGKDRKKGLSVHTKLVLVISAILLLGGTALFALLEWDDPATIGDFTTGQKLLAAAFQSVTCRSAGFASVDQAALREPSKALSCLLMLIGGSSGSTAGGVKTVTVGVLFLALLGSARGHSQLTVFHRTIGQDQVRQAATIMGMVTGLAFAGAIFLSAVEDLPFLDCLCESCAAISTAGLTAWITPALGTASKIMLIVFMFFGRVGIMTVSFGFLLGDPAEERFHYAETKVLIG